MLEVLTKIICLLIMTISGFFVIKKITGEKVKLLSIKNIITILLPQIIPCILYEASYQEIYTLIIFFISIIIYKIIFKKSICETMILTGIMMILSFITDLLTILIFTAFMDVEIMRTVWYIRILSNSTSALLCIGIASIPIICKLFKRFTKKLSNIKFINSVAFIVFMVLVFCIIAGIMYTDAGWNKKFLVEMVIVTIFLILFIIYTNEKNEYDNLTKRYDELFNYVQSFEELIEKEQLNRHEYKNQLAVLRCLTKEKKVKDKIDEILDDSINIEGDVVRKLSSLPKGGIKGLMYYKAAIAQKSKVKLDVTISLNSKSLLLKLSEKQIRVICKLIGIYFDNAIEASKETRKKNILVEVYELKDNVTFVFSNTFKKHKDFDKRNEKGISSKGEGHGNGLYFAKKLLDKNDWLESKQEVIDNYYIQQLIIKKENTSKK